MLLVSPMCVKLINICILFWLHVSVELQTYMLSCWIDCISLDNEIHLLDITLWGLRIISFSLSQTRTKSSAKAETYPAPRSSATSPAWPPDETLSKVCSSRTKPKQALRNHGLPKLGRSSERRKFVECISWGKKIIQLAVSMSELKKLLWQDIS